MALSPTELQAEELQQLRRLAQSPGWGLLQARLAKRVARSASEKASLLREGKTDCLSKVIWLQGQEDGLRAVEQELAKAMAELAEAAIEDTNGTF